MNWDLKIDKIIKKQLRKIPVKDARRIIDVISELPNNPYVGDIEKMKGEENVWRRRVGSYRIFYEIIIDKKIIYVYDVKRRTSSTY